MTDTSCLDPQGRACWAVLELVQRGLPHLMSAPIETLSYPQLHMLLAIDKLMEAHADQTKLDEMS